VRDGEEVTPEPDEQQGLYRVLLLNDDQTPADFVVQVIERFSGKGHEAARRAMHCVHGIGECGVYPYEAAKTKAIQVMDFARKRQHPLQ